MTKISDISKSVEKRIYSISELAREFGVTPRALRFYEDKGLLSPDREGLNRVYSNRDRARLKLILSGRKVGFSLNDIREILDLYDLDDNQRAQLRQAYKKHKQQVEVLKQQRIEIDDALEALNDGISWMEKKLDSFGPTDNEAEFARAYDAVARARLQGDTHEVETAN
jgi:DNA-binding transcriptional MerR regulator